MTEPLIHIGYYKTGTTWLQKWIFVDERCGYTLMPRTLGDDAFIAVDPFADDGEHAAFLYAPLFAEAASRGTVPVISEERLSGLPLLGGYDANALAQRLHSAFPQARVLIGIREQRSMMVSMYKQYLRESGTQKPARLWAGERSRPQRRRPGPRLEVYEYHRLIERYQALFGAERVLVLPFEALREDPVAFVGRIAAHVGVQAPDDVPRDSENVALPGALVPLVRFTNKILRTFGVVPEFGGGAITDANVAQRRRRLVRQLGRKVPSSWSRPFDRRLRKEIDEIAGDRFGVSNRLTAERTGLDLARYGYDVTPCEDPS